MVNVQKLSESERVTNKHLRLTGLSYVKISGKYGCITSATLYGLKQIP